MKPTGSAAASAISCSAKKPKDFDVTANATRIRVRKLFRNCRLVGRRFRWLRDVFGWKLSEI
ncbi:hypothetical protein KCP70_16910 [Salmonella enterica subsp. enterica]|nr:hypothetical protein KCP70_16910 [Salmonella enterica subsp. enterica]